MSVSPYKTWIAGEVLTASDLNASFTQIINNALSLISPLTGTLDANSNTISNLGTLALVAPVNEAKGTTVASATSTLIGAATGNYIHISGTSTITSFDTVQAGAERILIFDGALILTHSGTALILPGAANITTVAGDRAIFRSEGSGNWRCIEYIPAWTGTGKQVHDTSPTLVTPNLGVAAATSMQINGGDVVGNLVSGTWSPTLTTTGTAGTPAYSSQSGIYWRTGNFVFVSFVVTITGWTGSPTGNILLSGIPFNNANVGSAQTLGECILDGTGLTLGAGFTWVNWFAAPGDSGFRMTQAGSGKAGAAFPVSQYGSGTVSFQGSMCYRTA